jgi:hypothetical protein
MAFVLIDGAFTAGLLAALGSEVLGGLLHDPLHAPGAAGASGGHSAEAAT